MRRSVYRPRAIGVGRSEWNRSRRTKGPILDRQLELPTCLKSWRLCLDGLLKKIPNARGNRGKSGLEYGPSASTSTLSPFGRLPIICRTLPQPLLCRIQVSMGAVRTSEPSWNTSLVRRTGTTANGSRPNKKDPWNAKMKRSFQL